MTFEKAMGLKKEIETRVNKFDSEIKSFEKNKLGMVKEEISNSKEFKEIEMSFKLSFKELQNFNIWFNKAFKKEITEQRKNRWNKASII